MGFRKKLMTSSTQRGETAFRKNTNISLKNGKSFVVKKELVMCKQIQMMY